MRIEILAAERLAVHRRGFAVPRAHVLADVAVEDMPAHGLAQFAPARVEEIRLNQGVREASIDAQSAIAAEIGRGAFAWVTCSASKIIS